MNSNKREMRCARLTELVVINDSPLGSADQAVVEDAIRGQLRELGFRFDPDAVESLRLSITGKPGPGGKPCLEVTGELVRREAPYLPVLPFTSMRYGADQRVPSNGSGVGYGTAGGAGEAAFGLPVWSIQKAAAALADPNRDASSDLALAVRAQRLLLLGDVLLDVLGRVDGICAPARPPKP
jgi:hypothetical protein